MTLLYQILSVLLFALPLQDGRKFMILDMNSSYVIIDSKVMEEGDVFEEDSKIWWCFRNQTMKVMDVNTAKIYEFAAVSNHRNVAGHSDFWQYSHPLSTNDGESVVIEPSSYFYLTYIQNGEQKKKIMNLNIDLSTLPKDLTLTYHDVGSESEAVLTDDFRGFLAVLVEADRKAKEELSGTDYYVGEEQRLVADYMRLVNKYTDSRFKDIKYDYKDLKLFLKL